MDIIGHSIDKIEDRTGILEGDRYEFILTIEVPDDDELYSENGLYLKLIYVKSETDERIVQYHFYENLTNQPLDFELEEDEIELILSYCKNCLE